MNSKYTISNKNLFCMPGAISTYPWNTENCSKRYTMLYYYTMLCYTIIILHYIAVYDSYDMRIM